MARPLSIDSDSQPFSWHKDWKTKCWRCWCVQYLVGRKAARSRRRAAVDEPRWKPRLSLLSRHRRQPLEPAAAGHEPPRRASKRRRHLLSSSDALLRAVGGCFSAPLGFLARAASADSWALIPGGFLGLPAHESDPFSPRFSRQDALSRAGWPIFSFIWCSS
jgi:hypothetical protein